MVSWSDKSSHLTCVDNVIFKGRTLQLPVMAVQLKGQILKKNKPPYSNQAQTTIPSREVIILITKMFVVISILSSLSIIFESIMFT